MRLLIHPWAAVLLTVALCSSPRTQAPSIPEAAANYARREIEANLRMGIAIGLINADGEAFVAYGLADADDSRPLDRRSVFEIGSISKTFTGVLLADMVERGQMALDDPIQDYLPDSVQVPDYNGVAITLAHLSTHRSSLPRLPNNMAPADPQNPYADYTVEQMYRFLDRHDLRRAIGSEFEYSNLAVGLLGHILARHARLSYEELMVRRIAGPLGMGDTAIVLNSEARVRLAKGHAGTTEVKNWDIPTLAGAGAIRSTVADMLRYVGAHMGLIETELAPAMKLAQQRHGESSGGSEIGLGWMLRPAENTLITWHNGGTGGYRTFVGFNDQGLGVVVLSNTSRSVDALGFHLLDGNLPLPELREPAAVEPEILKRYPGAYELTPGFVLTIRLKDGGLTGQATNQSEFALLAASETEFFLTAVEASITFEVNDAGESVALVLHQGGLDQRMVKR